MIPSGLIQGKACRAASSRPSSCPHSPNQRTGYARRHRGDFPTRNAMKAIRDPGQEQGYPLEVTFLRIGKHRSDKDRTSAPSDLEYSGLHSRHLQAGQQYSSTFWMAMGWVRFLKPPRTHQERSPFRQETESSRTKYCLSQ